MENLQHTQPATDAGTTPELATSDDQTEPLSLEDAFKQLAFLACQDERGMILDCATEAEQINRIRAAFAQARGQLDPLEAAFEDGVSDHVAYLRADLDAIETRGRN